jgi:hypothetical protein
MSLPFTFYCSKKIIEISLISNGEGRNDQPIVRGINYFEE